MSGQLSMGPITCQNKYVEESEGKRYYTIIRGLTAVDLDHIRLPYITRLEHCSLYTHNIV